MSNINYLQMKSLAVGESAQFIVTHANNPFGGMVARAQECSVRQYEWRYGANVPGGVAPANPRYVIVTRLPDRDVRHARRRKPLERR